MYDYTTNPEYFGYFDDPSQIEPTYDPGQNAPCLICGKPWMPGTVHITIFATWDETKQKDTCYFYRFHRTCHDGLGSDEQREEFEGRMFESTQTSNNDA